MACRGGVYDIHHAANRDIELTGPDDARGIWSLNFRTILTGPRQVTRLPVEYDDVYRRHEGCWWIAQSMSRVTSGADRRGRVGHGAGVGRSAGQRIKA